MANFLIYGKRRQGKSTLALALALAEHNCVVIFDPNNQYPLVGSCDWEQFEEKISAQESRELSQGPLRVREAGEIVLLRVGPFDTEEVESAFTRFSDILADRRNISIVIDEAHMLQGSNTIHPDLDRWNRRSPADVAVIATTHRIVDAHPDTRYHADHVFFFFAYLPREIKTIRENFGDDVAEAVPDLQPYQVIHWRKGPGARPEWDVWPNGEEWFIDLENNNK